MRSPGVPPVADSCARCGFYGSKLSFTDCSCEISCDGRMSGASGKVPAAIHVTPEAKAGGPLALVRDGDIIRLDAHAGTLELRVDPAILAARTPATAASPQHGYGRELFGWMRRVAGPAEAGACVLFEDAI